MTFRLLCREFFGQFFTAETSTSESRLRQAVIGFVTFIFAPGFLLLIQLLPRYSYVLLRARHRHDVALLDDTLEWTVMLFVTFSMLTVGLAATFVWDALAFDRRDAMVLGPLPVRRVTIVGAKLTALSGFFLAISLAVNTPSAALFAAETSDGFGAVTALRHFIGYLAATVLAAAVVFAAVVLLRGIVAMFAGSTVTAVLGSAVQMLFVVGVLGVVFLSPATWRIPHPELVNPKTTGWLPSSWYVGLFEFIRGSARVYFHPLAVRAAIVTPITIGAAALVCIAGFSRQMRLALTPAMSPGVIGTARISRSVARLFARRAASRATADFILVTIARNRAQQSPIAINVAVGIAFVLAAFVRTRGDLAALMQPRTVILSIPLVLAFWIAIGLRASFFIPSELPAAWLFRFHELDATDRHRAIRAAVAGWLAPFVLLLNVVVMVPLLGWAAAARHGAFVLAMVVLLADVIALTVRHTPFTWAYQPGHAKLRWRWPVYLIGSYWFAYGSVARELRVWRDPADFGVLVAEVALAVIACRVATPRLLQWRARKMYEDAAGDEAGMTVLALTGG